MRAIKADTRSLDYVSCNLDPNPSFPKPREGGWVGPVSAFGLGRASGQFSSVCPFLHDVPLTDLTGLTTQH